MSDTDEKVCIEHPNSLLAAWANHRSLKQFEVFTDLRKMLSGSGNKYVHSHQICQTISVVHPAFCGYRPLFPWKCSGRNLRLTSRPPPRLVPKSGLSEVLPPLPLYAFVTFTRTAWPPLPLYAFVTFTRTAWPPLTGNTGWLRRKVQCFGRCLCRSFWERTFIWTSVWLWLTRHRDTAAVNLRT